MSDLSKGTEELRENILKFYPFTTERDFEDVKREYLGIAPAGSPKYTVIISNRLHIATDTFVANLMSDVKYRDQQIALAAQQEFSWDSVSLGWNDKEQHERLLILMHGGKIVKSLKTNDDKILRDYSYDKENESYLHQDLVRQSHIELWARQEIATLKAQEKS